MDALKELELQCKERIDLLEALRVSRQDSPSLIPSGKLSKAPDYAESNSRSKASIGDGTIPAVTYSELSRPSLPQRPSFPNRQPTETNVNSHSSRPNLSVSMTNSPKSHSPSRAAETGTPGRNQSPDKYTMRTTLRSGKANDKPSKGSRKSPRPAGEGPSKAATLAWSAISSREKPSRASINTASDKPLNQHVGQRHSSDQPRKSSSGQILWDSHSRRLVSSQDIDLSVNRDESSGVFRHSDEYPRPSTLSVSAASSALTSSQDCPPPTQVTNTPSNRPERQTNSQHAAANQSSRKPTVPGTNGAAGVANGMTRRKAPDRAVKRKDVPRKAGESSKQVPSSPDKPSRGRSGGQQVPPQPAVPSSSDDDNQGAAKRYESRETSETDDFEAQNSSDASAVDEEPCENSSWKRRKEEILKNLPSGVDESAAKQILNDIVVQGDEVRWGDIAGLEIAKNALREAVVYPFLRPDLFMGLREPARGMLLFGPPGTGKTMLARAVATESRSTFFSISASSLTSKFLGESEKLVRALFALAKFLAPSIIFVDEIDSLLSQRSGSGEHEATRRIKTEFLIQWSDLQRAAAGRETTEKDKERGDANRVLVLAATNLPWAIDEAARRRFVRRQYIPLPEPSTRETQLRTLLGQQKHSLSDQDIHKLIALTEGKTNVHDHQSARR